MGIAQISGFVTDCFIGNQSIKVNIILTVVDLLGIDLSWYGLRMN